jgi:hypothetical protein
MPNPADNGASFLNGNVFGVLRFVLAQSANCLAPDFKPRNSKLTFATRRIVLLAVLLLLLWLAVAQDQASTGSNRQVENPKVEEDVAWIERDGHDPHDPRPWNCEGDRELEPAMHPTQPRH